MRSSARVNDSVAVLTVRILHDSGFQGGVSPHPLSPRKLSIFNGLQKMVLQNLHNKRVAAKIFFLKKLAPEGGPGLVCFDLYIQYSGLKLTKMPCGCC